MAKCERCGVEDRFPGERYCEDCALEVLAELDDKGYLQPLEDQPREYRGDDAREDVLETKFGVDR